MQCGRREGEDQQCNSVIGSQARVVHDPYHTKSGWVIITSMSPEAERPRRYDPQMVTISRGSCSNQASRQQLVGYKQEQQARCTDRHTNFGEKDPARCGRHR